MSTYVVKGSRRPTVEEVNWAEIRLDKGQIVLEPDHGGVTGYGELLTVYKRVVKQPMIEIRSSDIKKTNSTCIYLHPR